MGEKEGGLGVAPIYGWCHNWVEFEDASQELLWGGKAVGNFHVVYRLLVFQYFVLAKIADTQVKILSYTIKFLGNWQWHIIKKGWLTAVSFLVTDVPKFGPIQTWALCLISIFDLQTPM